MLNVFAVLWASIAVILTTVVARRIPNRSAGLAGGALVWALYRSLFTHVSWGPLRPLDIWWVLLIVLLVGVMVGLVFIKQPRWTIVVGWTAAGVAVLAPFNDLFTASFWGGWLNEPAEVKIAMVLCMIVLTILAALFVNRFSAIVLGGLLLVTIVAWVQFALTGSAGPAPAATTTTTTTATPASLAPTTSTTTTTTTTPASPAPSATPTTPTTPTATAGSVIGWDNVLAAVERANATAAWQKLVDANHEKLGFTWKEATDWGTTKTADGQFLGTRAVTIFGASASEISDDRARELAGVGGTNVPVFRAGTCLTTIIDGGRVCPVGDARVMLFIAPIGAKDDGTPALKPGSGVVILPSTDNKVTLELAMYNVA